MPDVNRAAADAAAGRLMLDVGDGHRVFVEAKGRVDGVPAVFLHGGPGSGCQPAHRALFDQRFRAVLFDQRGAGRSTPVGRREANTTHHLIADMEVIRETLGIERWMLVGGSWGATLALAYAETHPERVSGMVLRAVFLGTNAELGWAFGAGLASVYPLLHRDFLGVLPEEERGDPVAAYLRRILDTDPTIHRPAAFAWHDTERVLSEIAPAVTRLDQARLSDTTGRLPATPFMEAHYFANGCFFEEDQLLVRAGRLRGIPGRIIQGRFDLLCPPATSQRLADAWTDARISMVERAGHAMGEPGVTGAMRRAVNELAGL